MSQQNTQSATTSPGYGPSKRLIFSGDESKYELWEIKFLGHMRLHKLFDTIVQPGEGGVAAPDEAKNADAFAEIVQYLDDRSLSLIMRDAKNNGRRALEILREHYLGKGKPRIISLYTELTSLKMKDDEKVTDYMIRAETAATCLKTAGENISDSLLVAMVLKGLPSQQYGTFSTVITQKEKEVNFTEFKIALRSFEESEKCRRNPMENDDSIMKAHANPKQGYRKNSNPVITCYECGKSGHKSFECKSKGRKGKTLRWCEHCKSSTHDTKFCRKKDVSVKSMKDNDANGDDRTFAFKASINDYNLNDCILLLSGRCGWDIVAKAARANIPCIASLGAASTLAAETARKLGIKLYTFVKPDRSVIIG